MFNVNQASSLVLLKGTQKEIITSQSQDLDDSKKTLLPEVKVVHYDENEETTCVDTAILLTSNGIKRWLVVPFLSLLTCMIFPIFLYWKISLQRDMLYTRASSITTATHIYIKGRGK